MALKTFVKVGNISNLSDARYCAGMGVDLLGFCLDSSSDAHLSPESYKEIVGWISGPKLVGEFDTHDAGYILKAQEELNFDFIQIDDLSLANSLSRDNKVILKISLHLLSDDDSLTSLLSEADDNIQYLLLESDTPVDSHILQEIETLSKAYPILKGFDLEPASVLNDISMDYKGIALKGSEELKAGFKDYDELADILEVLELDD